MCLFKQPKIKKEPKKEDPQSLAMRNLELARAGIGSSRTTNPTGPLGVQGPASVAGKTLSAVG